jgi:hypothetical protein
VAGVTFARGRLAGVVGIILIIAFGLLLRQWDSFSWHARGMILAIMGLSLMLGMALPSLRIQRRLTSGAQAQGTVVATEQREDHGTEAPVTQYSPVVRFTTPDHRTVVFTSAVFSEIAPDVGARVPVRYRPDDPDKAEVDTPIAWVIPAAIGLVGGLGLLVAGVIVYVRG